MRRISPALLVVAFLAAAHPSGAATWSIGPSIAFEVMSSGGEVLAMIAAPSGTDLTTFGAKPGLRLGVTGESQQHQLFFDTGLLVVSGSGGTLHVVSGTVNYAYFFRPGSSPYVTAGFGGSNLGFDTYSEGLTYYGLGLGGRHRLGHGHGAIRVEARFDRATSAEAFTDALHIVGVRVGFDLDLN
jgi:hypothetical protein